MSVNIDLAARQEIDIERLDGALAVANLPSLVMVLFQLTGDERWIRDPYRPTKPKGMSDHDSGGFSDEVQQQIRAAVREAILEWAQGAPIAVPTPTGSLLRELMTICVNEEVPDSYEPMIAEQMGFADPIRIPDVSNGGTTPVDFSVVIIGAGISGLLASLRLREAGVPNVVFERESDIGGVWRTNRYPGAGVDTPSHLYSFSFYRRNWSRYYGKRDEVIEYLEDFTDHFNLRPGIRFNTRVISAVYDEASQKWTVTVENPDGSVESVVANAVISAVGIFSEPNVPDIPGAESFNGPVFHSSYWPADLDVEGKRVAVIGSGASAMQIVPAIVGKPSQITIFQRTPQWAAPANKYFEHVDDDVRWLMDTVPFYQDWYRFRLAWMFNDKVQPTLFRDPEWEHPDRSLNAANDRHRASLTKYILGKLEGREDLQAIAVPDYPPYGKRMLIDNGWFDAIKRPDVEIIPSSAARITETGVVSASGEEREADIIVLSTGFHSGRFLLPLEVRGRAGESLRETWEDDNARAFQGIAAPSFPNLFFLYGPNTNGSGGSFLYLGESQVGHVVSLITSMISQGKAAVEPRRDRYEEYNARIDDLLGQMVWSHQGVDTYYRNSKGRVVTNMPWSVVEYWSLMREPDLDNFVFEDKKGA
ncbi:NAD(P)/FAD-dependent oxidoreductase [Arthrobacter sp. I2-34]|uniref:NAD(P)/FAD-dependent oxidoreductase n=1 Tax=Arthrobacter hankyongi TaxID=2904801 RepID=A0ABS9L3F3_9MICC|nr:NAD(P)/FAD-dependent oxidoreductase [Arthrobacter hankyongi]MCG2621214.1 NAD(P)/FAD-dependent oxidoreductase [Arthrobacter hankyongi]